MLIALYICSETLVSSAINLDNINNGNKIDTFFKQVDESDI